MADNSTSSPSAGYDEHILAVNPNYRSFHKDTLELVRAAVPNPQYWLDTGCGTGTLAAEALHRFPGAEFTLADPSDAMLAIAKQKLAFAAGRIRFVQAGTQELTQPGGSFDVVTAILCHHYCGVTERAAATANCFRMLRPGGVYVTFEHVRPFSNTGLQIALGRWREFQLDRGRNPEEVEKHLSRFDGEYFPITMSQHLELLKDAGFEAAEVLYAGYMQAGFYAIKGPTNL